MSLSFVSSLFHNHLIYRAIFRHNWMVVKYKFTNFNIPLDSPWLFMRKASRSFIWIANIILFMELSFSFSLQHSHHINLSLPLLL